jgi:hypothetical protein
MDDLNSVGSSEQIRKPVPKQLKPNGRITKIALAVILITLAMSALYVYATYYLSVTVPISVTTPLTLVNGGVSGFAAEIGTDPGTYDKGTCAASGGTTITCATISLGVGAFYLNITINNPGASTLYNIWFSSNDTSRAIIELWNLIPLGSTTVPNLSSPVVHTFPTGHTVIQFQITTIQKTATITVYVGT